VEIQQSVVEVVFITLRIVYDTYNNTNIQSGMYNDNALNTNRLVKEKLSRYMYICEPISSTLQYDMT